MAACGKWKREILKGLKTGQVMCRTMPRPNKTKYTAIPFDWPIRPLNYAEVKIG